MRGLVRITGAAIGIAAALLVLASAMGQPGTPPALAWSPGSFDYGTIDAGSSTSQEFILTNSGGSGTGALNVALSGSAAFSIIADACTGTGLGPGRACAVTIDYAPTTSGASDSSTLTASSRSPRTANAAATLIGASTGNIAPTVTIDVPVEGGVFTLGNLIPFSVTVADPEDGTIDCGRVTVTFVLAHDLHGHEEESVNGCTGLLPTIVDDIAHGGNVWGIIRASYTDLGGPGGIPALTTVAETNIRQRLQQVEFALNQSGTTNAISSDGGVHRGSLGADDWIELNGPFNLLNISSLTFRVADAAAGRTAGSPLAAVQVREGSQSGPILATANLTSTGATNVWQSQTFPLPNPGGTVRLFLVFQTVTDGAAGEDLFNLNWVQFEGSGVGNQN